MKLKCMGPLICRFFQKYFLPYDFLNNSLFSLVYFIVRIQYIINNMQNRVIQLFMLSVRLPVNNRLLVKHFFISKVLGESKVTFGLLFKDQL